VWHDSLHMLCCKAYHTKLKLWCYINGCSEPKNI